MSPVYRSHNHARCERRPVIQGIHDILLCGLLLSRIATRTILRATWGRRVNKVKQQPMFVDHALSLSLPGRARESNKMVSPLVSLRVLVPERSTLQQDNTS